MFLIETFVIQILLLYLSNYQNNNNNNNNNNKKKKKKRDNKSHRRENFVIVKPFLFPLCGQVLTKPTPKTLVRQPRDLGTSNADQARQFASILTHI